MTEPRKNVLLVLRELMSRHASGVLAVRAPDVTGEIRLRTGEIDDVLFGRAEGVKALARMLIADGLTFAFRQSEARGERRIEVATADLLAQATLTRDALARGLAEFESRRDSFAIGVELTESTGAVLSAPARALWARLRAPASFSEIFDLVSDDDTVTVSALAELEACGALRWLELESERQPLLVLQWDAARAVERLGREVRLVIAGTPHRVAVFEHALLHIDDVLRPAREEPLVPMPHVIGTLGLEGASVDVVACPLVPAYSPLWGMSLAGAALVVRLDEAAPGLLEAAAERVGARVVAGESLVGPFDEGRVGAVAALVRAALDAA